ncbi:MAG: serine hydrolase domain-containing protein [Gemmatimonadaceae bacterium]
MTIAQPATNLEAIRTAALEHLQATGTPGLAIAITSGDSVVFAEGFGVASVETKAQVTPDILFQIGSLTKVFTATAAMLLAAEERVGLHERLSAYLDSLALPPSLAHVNMHQLLSQTSGLKDEPAGDGLHDESALAAYVRSWGDEYSLLEPGRVFSYSNPGYTLAGLVIEKAGGKPYADQMRERIFAPMGMVRTTFRPTEAMTYPLAMGHGGNSRDSVHVMRPLADDARKWPAGYMFSSARDLARFAIALANNGRVNGKQVLPEKVVEALSTPRTDVPNIFVDAHYGYGLFIQSYRGESTLWHPGTMSGFSAIMRVVPGKKLAVIVLGNRDGVRMDRVVEAALDALLGGKASPPSPQVPKAAMAMGATDMARYVGSYSNRWKMEVFMKDGRLHLRRFDQEHPISWIGGRRFSVSPPGSPRREEFVMVPDSQDGRGYLHMFLWAFGKGGKN